MYKVNVKYRCGPSVKVADLVTGMRVVNVVTDRTSTIMETSFYKETLEEAKQEVDLQLKYNTMDILPIDYTISLASLPPIKTARLTLDIEVLPTWIRPNNESERRHHLPNITKHLHDRGFTVAFFSESGARSGFSALTAYKDYGDFKDVHNDQEYISDKVPVISGQVDVSPFTEMLNGKA